ncbi:MAG: hypothetical protein FJW61_00400 [Actinobacteria bacterium]|nr:hypothetical protein [Actinomycetota bacterium]
MFDKYNNKDPIYSYQPLWGYWYIDSPIGEGSFGRVYKATRSELGYSYTSAVKIITIPSKEQLRQAISSFGDDKDTLKSYFEGMVENILSEVNLLYRLRANPNIITYEDHMVIEKKDELGWDILLRMEYATPLPEYLKKNRLNIEDIIKLGIDILAAISICSKNNIIHRDIKDENIFISGNLTFKLGDFGIAKELSKSGKAASFRGTPLFMSPEVFKGEKYDIRSDIYSLGIVMYKLLNKGRIPFMPPYPQKVAYKDSDTALIKRLTGSPIPAPAYVFSKELSSVVLKACSYSKQDRYTTPDDMRKDLYRILSATSESILNRYVTALPGTKEEKIIKTIPIVDIPRIVKKVEEIKPEVIEASEEIPPVSLPIPWYKKSWAIASFALFFIVALSLSLFFLIYKTYQKDKPDETAKAIVSETTEGTKTTVQTITSEGEGGIIKFPAYTYKILFCLWSGGDTDIYSMNTDGTELINLTNNNTEDLFPSYSIGNSKIAYICRTIKDDETSDEIFIMGIDGSNKKQLTDDNYSDWAPAISPDGSKILYTSDRNGVSVIYIMNSDGSNQVKLTTDADDAKFSPDGKKILFWLWSDGNPDVFIMDLNGSNIAKLTKNPGWERHLNFSPDGKRIVYTYIQNDTAEIYIMNSDGSNQTKLTDINYACLPSFSLNGNKITFTKWTSNNQEIYIMNPDGSGQIIVPNFNRNGFGSVFIPYKNNTQEFLEIDSSSREGVKFVASSSGTYEFEIVGGCWSPHWNEFGKDSNFAGWRSGFSIFKNKPIEWGKNENFDELGVGIVNESGNLGSPYLQSNYLQAEEAGRNSKMTVNLNKNDYMIFIVPDYYDYYEDNYGTMIVSVKKISDLSINNSDTSIISDDTSNISKQSENTNETIMQNIDTSELNSINLKLNGDGYISNYYEFIDFNNSSDIVTIKFWKYVNVAFIEILKNNISEGIDLVICHDPDETKSSNYYPYAIVTDFYEDSNYVLEKYNYIFNINLHSMEFDSLSNLINIEVIIRISPSEKITYDKNETLSTNLIPNSSFEYGNKNPDNWITPYGGADFNWNKNTARTGNYSINISNINENSSTEWLTKDFIQIERDKKYICSVWVKGTSDLEAYITIWFFDSDGNSTGPGYGIIGYASSDWTQIIEEIPQYNIWQGTTKVKISLGINNPGVKNSGCVWFDDAYLGL